MVSAMNSWLVDRKVSAAFFHCLILNLKFTGDMSELGSMTIMECPPKIFNDP